MFHVADNLFFGRRPDGSVRILRFAAERRWDDGSFPSLDQEYPEAVLDQTVSADVWASVIASVSAQGESAGRWGLARNFHMYESVGVDANGTPVDEGGKPT